MNDISTALWITALGMGLVFGAIIVLWLTIVILTAAAATREPEVPPPALPETAAEPADDRARAAAAAVTMALAEQALCSAHPLPEPPTAIVSAWQLGMRTRLLAQKGTVRRP